MLEYESVSGHPEFVSVFLGIVENSEASNKAWVESLRKQWFKAAHPNDGWVDRTHNSFQLVYPHFNDGVCVGDKVMLGWHSENPTFHRPVIVIAIEKSMVFTEIVKYYFIDMEDA